MSVSIRNIKKFVAEHPELGAIGDRIISAAEDKAGDQPILLGESVRQIMGELAWIFFREVNPSCSLFFRLREGEGRASHALLDFEALPSS